MKRYFAALLVLTTLCLGWASQVLAGYCDVTVESDNTSTSSSLRYKLENVVDNGTTSNCSMRYYESGHYKTTNDYEHFNQGIIFETPEFGGSVRTITLGSAITINAYNSLVIGNLSLNTFTDSTNEVADAKNGVTSTTDDFLVTAGIMSSSQGFTFYGYDETFISNIFDGDWNDTTKTLYNYGTVIIDARNVDGAPFLCDSSSAEVYLRDMVILTKSTSDSDLFADSGDTACLKRGGNQHVCSADKLNEDVYNTWVADGGGDSSTLPSNWCSKTRVTVVPTFPGTFPGLHTKESNCTDGIDNDSDGATDCDDSDCATDSACTTPTVTETSCTDEIDNDGDGATDCGDSDCTADSACITTTESSCTDGIDNDGDVLSDCDDSDCATDSACTTPTGTETSCTDGVDNDSDSYLDCNDSDCVADAACVTTSTETSCSDSVDNDGDGLVDCDDSDCALDSGCSADVETDCLDNIDNDGDGAVDCQDADCSGVSECADVDADYDGYTPTQGDCDDTSTAINPGADEICLDIIDNNCDGVIDETATCIDLSQNSGDNGDYQLEGGGGCGCDLKSRSSGGVNQALIALLALVPILLASGLRTRAKSREQNVLS